MIITYFNYVWGIESVSAGAATKAREIIGAINNLGHTAHLHWRTPQPTNGAISTKARLRQHLKPLLQKYLHEPKKLALNSRNLLQEYKILQEEHPDILFSRLELYNFSVARLSRWLNIPLVLEADCPPSYEHSNFYGKHYMHLGNFAAKIEIASLKRAGAVIAISSILKNYYVERGVPAEKIHVIPNGADPVKFRPREKPKHLVQKYNLAGKTVIGWVGALVGWSGVEEMVRMAEHVLQNYPEAAFLLVGGGDNQALFERRLRRGDWASRVILPGQVPHDQVPDYLACTDIVLAPYPKLPFWYASSMKIFEYMAAGKAIVTSNVGQIGEVIADGRNGLFFEAEKEDDLLAKTTVLLRDARLRQKLGRQARQDVLEKYTWEQHGKTIVAIFEALLRERKAKRVTVI